MLYRYIVYVLIGVPNVEFFQSIFILCTLLPNLPLAYFIHYQILSLRPTEPRESGMRWNSRFSLPLPSDKLTDRLYITNILLCIVPNLR